MIHFALLPVWVIGPVAFIVLLVILRGACGRRRCASIWLAVLIGLAALVVYRAALRVPPRVAALPGTDVPLPPHYGDDLPLDPPHYVARPSTAPATQTAQLWIDDWTAFTNSTHFTGFRVESSDTCATESESLKEATDAAARDLYTVVSARPEMSSRRIVPNQSNLLMQQLTSAVVSREVVAEQYVRTTEKPYGTLWKTYLLIDTSPSKIDPLVHKLNQQISVQNRRELTAAGSVAATILVVLLLYAFLNTVTKGYFVWRLRAAVLLVMIAAVMIAATVI